MRVVIQLLICFICSQLALAQEPFTGVVTKVIDGDSLQITVNGKKIETRLYGIDSPEYDQDSSKGAKKFVVNQVSGKQVTVYPQYNDSYGRLVAIISLKGKSLNYDLVASGYAWVYPRYCKKAICSSWEEAQKKARKKRLGLWSEKKPVPPWRWKRMKRQ